MDLDFNRILAGAQGHRQEIFRFLRDMIAIPSESCQEERIILRIREEMEKVGFDRVVIDPMGNCLGYIGQGKHLIAIDAHVDTVGVGDRSLWNFDPYQGFEDEDFIGGRGSSDQEGGMAAAVYGGKLIKEFGLEGDYTLVVTATVQEEDCDGLCWQYIIHEDKLRPEFVVITEPTACRVYRGHRGRMEIKVTTHGLSCHGSAPERGDNAIYKMAPILMELRALNANLKHDDFLGQGSLTVSEIFFSSPSRCAVADGCTISVDRRLTLGETGEMALQQIRNLPSVKQAGAEVSLYDYSRPSYKGLVYPAESYFPTWVVEEDHPACRTLVEAYRGLFREEPPVDKWTFSTNGAAIMGRHHIPCIGFGPGHEEFNTHGPNEKTLKSELIRAAAMYAVVPSIYAAIQESCTPHSLRPDIVRMRRNSE